ncbi:hypothetical protein CABS01_02661 [Colletotrichum abscissum]|uniref:Uncharacterized protein n=1 Tax=Colletotrichum abscissum TaxID=1671311 RepID=A0A9P9XRQ2_9PEZI|nr:uncharacterized protein CABS01_02661 [Colletotrichum abscissum]KAI3558102.1 hypothetical protein CABS02_01775 [Colletotrichum abscissum]KAK1482925.1 hypothetical protein CABS01_02661 [Colletotrichum abscissum]
MDRLQRSSGNRQLKISFVLQFLVQRPDKESSSLAACRSPNASVVDRIIYESVIEEERQDLVRIIANGLHQIDLPTAIGTTDGAGNHQYPDPGVWNVSLDEQELNILGSPRWHLARIRSPLMPMIPQTSAIIISICSALKVSRNLTIALNEIPRLRVDVKPKEGDFTLPEVRRILNFLWFASPCLNELHAPYCGPGSLVAPGLEFARMFSTDLHAFLSDAEWRGEPTEAFFTRGLPTANKVNMLEPPSIRGLDIENEAIVRVNTAESFNDIISGTEIHIRDWEGRAGIFPGANDFSRLLEKDPTKKTIGFSQHAGTLDSAAIENWIKVCHGIINFCLNETEDQVERVVGQLKLPISTFGFSGSYTTTQFLEDINLHAQAAYYEPLGRNPFVPELDSHRLRKPAINLEDEKDLSPYTFGIEFEFLVPFTNTKYTGKGIKDQRWVYDHFTPYVIPSPSKPTTQDERDELADLMDKYLGTQPKDERGQAHDESAKYLERLLCDAGHFGATFDTVFDLQDKFEGEVSIPGIQSVADAAGCHLHFFEDVLAMFQCWYIERDPSLSDWASGEKGYAGHIGIEMSSPILRDSPKDFGKIVDVLKILRGGLRPMLDISCGLHVHVGSVRGFSLRSLKRIATLIMIADPILYTLVHPSRQWNPMTEPLHLEAAVAKAEDLPDYTAAFVFEDAGDKSRSSPLQVGMANVLLDLEANVPMNDLPRKLRGQLAKLWATNSFAALLAQLAPFRGCKGGTAFGALKWDFTKQSNDPRAKGTIEFRMLEGTLDPVLITHWTKLLLRIVERGDAATTKEYFETLSILAKERGSAGEKLAALLGALGLEKHLPFWSKVQQTNQAMDVELEENDYGRKIMPENWELPIYRETEGNRQEFERSWFERNVVRIPELEEDVWDRIIDIL